MFSLEKIYFVLHNNLVSKIHNGKSIYFYPYGTYNYKNLLYDSHNFDNPITFNCYFCEQEPIYTRDLIQDTILGNPIGANPNKMTILVTSEHSQVIKDFVTENKNFYNWYYFFHGFAALDWYRDFQYVNSNSFDRFTKVFICFNHLVSKYRSYRLHLVSNLISQDLIKYGSVSLSLKDEFGTWQEEIEDADSLLDHKAKQSIRQTLCQLQSPLTIDTADPTGSLSASVDLELLTSALWHVVTETVYFFPKLHLTEKAFKPIIAQRPFILVAAVGNLAYLRSYGFKTFDRWIDESYDQEPNHYIRIEKITREIAKLCSMPMEELEQMHSEMKETLKFNYDHFYGNFKTIITNELVDNFKEVVDSINNSSITISNKYLDDVKQRLLK